MPLKIVFSRPQNWSRLKPYYSSTITAVKDFLSLLNPDNPWKRREKRSKKQGIPCKEKKTRNFKKTRKGRTGMVHFQPQKVR